MSNHFENTNIFGLTPKGIFIAVLIAWAVTGVTLYWYDDRGTFGDMFGAINALFSGLAFAGIIVTILLQRQELELQRKELTETRKEFETQNTTLKVQRFESTFFNLLNNHNRLISEFSVKDKINEGTNLAKDIMEEITSRGFESSPRIGRLYIRHFYDMVSRATNTNETYEGEQYDLYQSCLTYFPEMIVYFEGLRLLLAYVDSTELISRKQDKDFYIDIIKSNLLYYEAYALNLHLRYCEDTDENIALYNLALQYNFLETPTPKNG
jgi:hypothetical protein